MTANDGAPGLTSLSDLIHGPSGVFGFRWPGAPGKRVGMLECGWEET